MLVPTTSAAAAASSSGVGSASGLSVKKDEGLLAAFFTARDGAQRGTVRDAWSLSRRAHACAKGVGHDGEREGGVRDRHPCAPRAPTAKSPPAAPPLRRCNVDGHVTAHAPGHDAPPRAPPFVSLAWIGVAIGHAEGFGADASIQAPSPMMAHGARNRQPRAAAGARSCRNYSPGLRSAGGERLHEPRVPLGKALRWRRAPPVRTPARWPPCAAPGDRRCRPA